MSQTETLVGDGVYASFDGYQIWLRTAVGNNRIALQPVVFNALVKYIDLQEAINLVHLCMCTEIDDFINQLGLASARDALSEIIDAHTELDADGIDGLTARFFLTVAGPVSESIKPAFESAMALARQNLFAELALISKKIV